MTPLRKAGRWLLILGSISVGLGLSACKSTRELSFHPGLSGEVISDPQFVGFREKLMVTFQREGEEAISEEVVVKEIGTISLPLFGQFYVYNKTCDEVAAQIEAAILDERPERPLRVTVEAVPTPIFFIGGEVRIPSRYPCPSEMTVSKAIAAAGDFTDKANRKKVKLIRANGRETLTLNLARGEAPEPTVYPGDQIIVPSK